MNKDERIPLGLMLDRARKVLEKVGDGSREDFDKDENLRLALAFLIQAVGEAARKVPETIRLTRTEIPWKRIMGMRHRIVHDYMNIDEDIIWKVATVHIPQLIEQLIDLGSLGGDERESIDE